VDFVTELRSSAQRKADVVRALERNADLWLATASTSGQPHLIAVSSWWDGSRLVIATRQASPTARNLRSNKRGRLALGTPEDVVMIDVTALDSSAVGDAQPELKAGFVAAAGWDPGEEGSDWVFFRLQPTEIQAYRGYGELKGRTVMRESQWLT
jgi:Pyridoxamine 5'-phosphate oxidase